MQTQVLLFFIIISGWLIGLSIAIYSIFAFFRKLTKNTSETDLKKILEKVLSREEQNKSEIGELARRISFVEEDGRLHVQKLSLVRFNPFKELGGDHSFSLAILNAEDSGIIITSLHTRDRTRVYMKDIKKGKSTFELSEEERKALGQAQKHK